MMGIQFTPDGSYVQRSEEQGSYWITQPASEYARKFNYWTK